MPDVRMNASEAPKPQSSSSMHHHPTPTAAAVAVCSPPRPGIKFLSPGRSNFAAHFKCAKPLARSALGPFAAFLRHSRRRRSSFSPPEIDSVAVASSSSSSQFSISNHGWMEEERPRVVSLEIRVCAASFESPFHFCTKCYAAR